MRCLVRTLDQFCCLASLLPSNHVLGLTDARFFVEDGDSIGSCHPNLCFKLLDCESFRVTHIDDLAGHCLTTPSWHQYPSPRKTIVGRVLQSLRSPRIAGICGAVVLQGLSNMGGYVHAKHGIGAPVHSPSVTSPTP